MEQGQLAHILTVLVPICAIIFVNLILFIEIARSHYSCKKHEFRQYNSSSSEKIRRQRAFIMTMTCFFNMGLTWILTFFAIIPGTTQYPFTYIFCILNTLQGFFIFLVYVLLSKFKYVAKKFQKKIGNNFKMSQNESESKKQANEEDDINNYENSNSMQTKTSDEVHDDAKTL